MILGCRQSAAYGDAAIVDVLTTARLMPNQRFDARFIRYACEGLMPMPPNLPLLVAPLRARRKMIF